MIVQQLHLLCHLLCFTFCSTGTLKAFYSLCLPCWTEWEGALSSRSRSWPPRYALGDGRRRRHGQRAPHFAEAGFAQTQFASALHAASSASSFSLWESQSSACQHGNPNGGLRCDRRTEGVLQVNHREFPGHRQLAWFNFSLSHCWIERLGLTNSLKSPSKLHIFKQELDLSFLAWEFH